MRRILRWLQRIVLTLVAGFVVVYMGDWAVFKLRGSPRSKVTINHYVTIPLKGSKQEFDYLGSIDESCAVSLFSQDGQTPCWQLRRHINQGAAI
jgi:hypothetical protein